MSGFKYIESNKVSKAQKRRDAKAIKKAEQLKRIEEGEKLDEHKDRKTEQEGLNKLLDDKGLKIHDIDADGDCLYKAIEHQLSISEDSLERLTFSQIRKKTSEYMLNHPDDFLPFLTDGDQCMSETSFRDYCLKIANTKEWGGHLELTAIAQLTKKSIKIIQAESSSPLVIPSNCNNNLEPIMLSFHKHLYHLGEHYNSVVKG